MQSYSKKVNKTKKRKCIKKYILNSSFKQEQLEHLQLLSKLENELQYKNDSAFFQSCSIYRYIFPTTGVVGFTDNIFSCFDVRLRFRIGVLHANTRVAYMELDNTTGKISIYTNNKDKLDYTGILLFDAKQLGITCQMVIDEILNFLYRGHSIRNPKCTCQCNYIPRHRFIDIGIVDTSRVGKCVVHSRFNEGISDKEIQIELGVTCMYKNTICGNSVYDILLNSTKFRCEYDMTNLKKWFLSDDIIINNRNKLLDMIRMNTFGIDVASPVIQYNLLFSDLRILQLANKVIIMPDKTNITTDSRIYPVNTIQAQFDDDIIDLWHTTL